MSAYPRALFVRLPACLPACLPARLYSCFVFVLTFLHLPELTRPFPLNWHVPRVSIAPSFKNLLHGRSMRSRRPY